MDVLFYNPGIAIKETLRFDHPTNDPRTQSNISYFKIDAPKESFFDVPNEIEVNTEAGSITVPVRFPDIIQREFRTYGVIRINPKPKGEVSEDDNQALNEKDAKEKGDRLWREYLKDAVRKHMQEVEQIRATGGVPLPARGHSKHALNVLGYKDPAEHVPDDVSQVSDLKSQLAKLQEQMASMAASFAKGK